MDQGIDLSWMLPFLTLVLCMSCLPILGCVRDPAHEAECCLLPLFWTDLVHWTCLTDASQLFFFVFLLKKEFFFSFVPLCSVLCFPTWSSFCSVRGVTSHHLLCLVRLTHQMLDWLGKVGIVSPLLLLGISEIVPFNRNAAAPGLSFLP